MGRKEQVVEVEWNDACGRNHWTSKETHHKGKPDPIRSVGYLAKRDKTCVVIVQSYAREHESANDSLCIPMGMVKSIKNVGGKRG